MKYLLVLIALTLAGCNTAYVNPHRDVLRIPRTDARHPAYLVDCTGLDNEACTQKIIDCTDTICGVDLNRVNLVPYPSTKKGMKQYA